MELKDVYKTELINNPYFFIVTLILISTVILLLRLFL